jgi:hypothetical protein
MAWSKCLIENNASPIEHLQDGEPPAPLQAVGGTMAEIPSHVEGSGQDLSSRLQLLAKNVAKIYQNPDPFDGFL